MLSRRLVPNELWAIVEPLIPPFAPRAQGGELTGPNPVDRGKPGSKLHLLTDAGGLPPAMGVTAPNTRDNAMSVPLLDGIPAIRSRREPRR